ncbi:hypothetical protein [Hymenobacter sp.]|uniref:hypothetical protein n=1 Tax=Hymenobacter sp. TaxID=1898978 RepID=UPI002ED9FD73
MLSWSYAVLPDTSGDAGPIELFSYQDVTQERSPALSQPQAQITEQNPNPIVQLDSQAKFVYANPASRQCWKITSKLQQRQIVRPLRQATATALSSGTEVRYEVTVGNSYFAACVVPYPIEKYVTVYLFDILIQREAEAELRDYQALYQEGLEATSRAVFVSSIDGQYLFKNRAMRELEQLLVPVGMSLQQAKAYSRKATRQSDARVLASGKEITEETKYMLASG